MRLVAKIAPSLMSRSIRSRHVSWLLAKSDVKQAYRKVPVHPQDSILLGMSWKGHYYVDASLPLWLRSAPLILSALVDALEWVVCQAGVKLHR